jgi:hypothetical protein
MPNKFKPGDYVKSKRFSGIAMYVYRNTTIHRDLDDDGFLEEIVADDCYDCVMVGDDMIHKIDEEDLELLPVSDFCYECGQIGCKHNVMEEE